MNSSVGAEVESLTVAMPARDVGMIEDEPVKGLARHQGTLERVFERPYLPLGVDLPAAG